MTIKRIFAVLMATILAVGCFATTALAASDAATTNTAPNPAEMTTVRFEHGAEEFVYNPENTDLWFNFKGLLPGDTVTQRVGIKNASDRKVAIYMHAEEGAPQFDDLFEHMTVKVMQGDTVLQESPVKDPGGLRQNILLGNFEVGAETILDVELKVSVDMGNEHQNDYGEIVWVFTVEWDEVVPPPQTGEEGTPWKSILAAAALVFIVVFIVVAQIMGRKRKADKSADTSVTSTTGNGGLSDMDD